MKKKYFFITFMFIGMLFVFNSCGIEDAINNIIEQVKNSLYDELSTQEQRIADFNQYVPPVTEDYVGNTPYSGIDYNDLSEEEQSMLGGGQNGQYSVNAIDRDMHDVVADNLAFDVYSDMLFVPLNRVRKIEMERQIAVYNQARTEGQDNIYFDPADETFKRGDGKALSAEEEATIQSFIKNAIAKENFLVKRKAASLLQEHTYNINGMLFSYLFQRLLVEKGGVPADTTLYLNTEFIDTFKSYYMNAVSRELPSILSLAGGVYLPLRAINNGVKIKIDLSDIVKYDFVAQGIENMYDVRISSKFTMIVDEGSSHEATFGGEDYIVAVFFKFDANNDITKFKFVFRSPMTKLWDYSELLIHDLASGEFTNIKQDIEPYFLIDEAGGDGKTTLKTLFAQYHNAGDYIEDVEGDYFPVLNVFTAKFKKDGDSAFVANAEYQLTGIKPLSEGIRATATGELDSTAHPVLDSLQVKGFIQKNAPAAILVKQFVGANVYDAHETTFQGKIDISADGRATNFQDDGGELAEDKSYRGHLRDLDDDNEDVQFESDIENDQEYKDMKDDHELNEEAEKLHQRPSPTTHQGMDHPLKVYEKSREIYLYFNVNIEDDDYDPEKFTITRGEANTEAKVMAVGADDNGISNFLVFILADSEPFPTIGEKFTVTADIGAITIKGVSNSERVSISAVAQSLDDRPHE